MFGSRFGAPDGRRTRQPEVLSQLGKMPFTRAQKQAIDGKGWMIQNAPPWVHPSLSLFNPPTDAYTFRWTSVPATLYPAAGESAVTILSYVVPKAQFMVINKLSIVHIGGNPPDFTGAVIWRVLKNGGGLRGLSMLTAQVGTFANPLPITPIVGIENDSFVVTVEVPTGFAPPPGGSQTAASFDGFTYPLSEATYPRQGSY
jgi:hypothetical protein